MFYKRKSFSHEKEVRVACFENESNYSRSITMSVTLDMLIHEVVVSPMAEDWEFGIVKETTKRFDEALAQRVRQSDIAKPTTLELLSGD